ncbi:MAG: recombinase family protein [Candidatus Pacebacteria bacterium]|nr:recombinase family protein [Candidatus Paceibacterota bacterium]
MRVALYARVSTPESDKKKLKDTDRAKQDPETQLVKLRAYAKAMGWQIIKTYIDRASGADPNRPSMSSMMADARSRKFDAIVIVRLDRITRSLANLLSTIEDLERWNVRLVCTDQMIETGSATGKLLIHLLGALAEFERELTRERIKDGMDRARAQGKAIGRPETALESTLAAETYARVKSYRKAAKELGVSEATVRRRVKRGAPSSLNTNEAKYGCV